MKKRKLFKGLTSASALLVASSLMANDYVVTANRASGDLSIISVESQKVMQTVALPGANPDPMYVVALDSKPLFLVGDRAASSVHVFNKETFAYVKSVGVAEGVFHMWANEQAGQLWVAADTAQMVSVIDIRGEIELLGHLPMPQDLSNQGYKPHDVFVTEGKGYVSLVNGSTESDVVLSYDNQTFAETARIEVANDPHLFSVDENSIMVAAQFGNEVLTLNAADLSLISRANVPGSHGIFASSELGLSVVANTPLADLSQPGLFAVSLDSAQVLAQVNVPALKPHNVTMITLNDQEALVYLTHSGATANLVSVYKLAKDPQGRVTMDLMQTIEVGLNPFGLTSL